MAREKIVEQPMFQTLYNRFHTDKGTTFTMDSLTDESYRLGSEIYHLLQTMAPGQGRTPTWGVQDNATFEDWQNEVALVKRRFMNLTEEQRTIFGSPQKFFEFCSNPDNFIKEEPPVPPVPPVPPIEE